MSDLESKDGYVEFETEEVTKKRWRFLIVEAGAITLKPEPAKREHFYKAGWQKADLYKAALKVGDGLKQDLRDAKRFTGNLTRLLERQEPLVKAAMGWYEGVGATNVCQALSDACCAFNIATNQSLSYAELQVQVGPPPVAPDKASVSSDALDATPLGTAQEERNRARLWMCDAVRNAQNSDFWQEKCGKREEELDKVEIKLATAEKQIRDLIDTHQRELSQLRVACERDCSEQYRRGWEAAARGTVAAEAQLAACNKGLGAVQELVAEKQRGWNEIRARYEDENSRLKERIRVLESAQDPARPLVDQALGIAKDRIEELERLVKELQGEILLIGQALIPEFADEGTVAVAERTRQWVRDLTRRLNTESSRLQERIRVLEASELPHAVYVGIGKDTRLVATFADRDLARDWRKENFDSDGLCIAGRLKTGGGGKTSPEPDTSIGVSNETLVAEARKELVAKLVPGSWWVNISGVGVGRANVLGLYTYQDGTTGVTYRTRFSRAGESSTQLLDWFLTHYEPEDRPVERCRHCGRERCEYQDHGGAPVESDLDSDPNSNSRVLIETEKKP